MMIVIMVKVLGFDGAYRAAVVVVVVKKTAVVVVRSEGGRESDEWRE